MNGAAVVSDFPERADLVSPAVPAWLLAIGCVVAGAAWVWLHRSRWFAPGRRGLRVALGLAAGAAACWAVLQFAGRSVVYATPWPLPVLAVLGAVAVELTIGAYALERKSVGAGRRWWITGLRLAALLLLVGVLAQPVLSWDVERRIEREVVVLLDDSDSMKTIDAALDPTETLDRAGFYGVPAAADRIDLSGPAGALEALAAGLRREAESAGVAPVPGTTGGGQAAGDRVREAIARAGETLAEVESALAELLEPRRPEVDGEAAGVLDGARDAVSTRLRSRLDEAGRAADESEPDRAAVAGALDRAAELAGSVADALLSVAPRVDANYYRGLPDGARREVDAAAAKPRDEIARDVVALAPPGGSDPLAAQLAERYRVRYVRFDRDAEEIDSAEFLAGVALPADRTDSSRGATPTPATSGLVTDVTGALEEALDRLAPDTLAGVVLLSDGRHNGRRPAEDIARRLGIRGAPVGAVAIGAATGPPDASILALDAAESLYLGDKLVAKADVRVDGMRGRTVRAVLRRGDEVVDEENLEVPGDEFRTTLRFRHVPAAKGSATYSVELEPLDGEHTTRNNRWEFAVAVTDDRKNVLLIDGFPRWEFRYLRNLFYARDKSVHLQYVLLNTEEIEGFAPLPAVEASASRPFGEAEATRLPASREEWLKFDAIIIGDVPPAVMGAEQWAMVDACVRERGALLVMIAGPRYLPHGFDDPVFGALVPVEFERSGDLAGVDSAGRFRLALTAEGRGSAVMRQAPSGLVSSEIWAGMPELYWRHPVRGTREGAEVLAYAEPVDGRRLSASRGGGSDAAGGEFGGLFEARQAQRAAPLVVTQRYALGAVAMLLFDQTWRFRYGVGDTYHHRLWGQLLRWGTGENLREGTEFVRLGTDRLTYEPGEPVRLLARVADRDYRPVTDGEVAVRVFRDGSEILTAGLDYRPSSNGIYEAGVDAGFDQPGRYRIVLEGDEAEQILAADGVDELAAEFVVATDTNPAELADLTVDRDFLEKVAALSGGEVVGPGEAGRLVGLFGPPSKSVTERLELSLWDKWPVLVAFVVLLTAEWLVRRAGGLV